MIRKPLLKKRLLALMALLALLLTVLSGCETGDISLKATPKPTQRVNTVATSVPSATHAGGLAPARTSTPSPVVTQNPENLPRTPVPQAATETPLAEDGSYSSKDDVALYIYIFGKLPSNYITKNEATELGWDSGKGNLWTVAPGKSIGGDRFGNYEGLLPADKRYRECDIDYDGNKNGGRRNGKRIVFSDDGYIFYTEDHYESFEQLYPEGSAGNE